MGSCPVLATLAALAVGAVMLLLLGVNPIVATRRWGRGIWEQQCVRGDAGKGHATALVAIGICISFRGDVINIGGEGQ